MLNVYVNPLSKFKVGLFEPSITYAPDPELVTVNTLEPETPCAPVDPVAPCAPVALAP